MKNDSKKTNKIGKYSVRVFCRNCGQGGISVTHDGEFFSNDFVMDVPKGTLLKDVKCPHCDCKKLSLKTE